MNLFTHLFDAWFGKGLAIFGLVATLIVGFVHDQRQIGARNATHDINASAVTLANKAQSAVAAVPDDGRDNEWLRAHACRDC